MAARQAACLMGGESVCGSAGAVPPGLRRAANPRALAQARDSSGSYLPPLRKVTQIETWVKVLVLLVTRN